MEVHTFVTTKGPRLPRCSSDRIYTHAGGQNDHWHSHTNSSCRASNGFRKDVDKSEDCGGVDNLRRNVLNAEYECNDHHKSEYAVEDDCAQHHARDSQRCVRYFFSHVRC